MSWVTLLGYAAPAAVLVTFCMNTMIPLRVIALASNVLELTESKAKQLYFQDRSFGFAVLQLIIARLVEDTERLLQAGTANLADFDIVVNSAAPAA